jgi:flavin reductase (DIM6/NTAB) family NADH-FMN oxidoreductase RutF
MHKKVKLGKNAFIFPMPVALVGTKYEGKTNFMTVSWISRVNASPAMLAFSSHKTHVTNKAIAANASFSVNFPGEELAVETDFCGLASADRTDKSGVFDIIYGSNPDCPMIDNCPLSMECVLQQTIELPSNLLFIAEIKAAYTEEKYLNEEGQLDISKMKCFSLTMPDNNYWSVGKPLGKAWKIGLDYKKKGSAE